MFLNVLPFEFLLASSLWPRLGQNPTPRSYPMDNHGWFCLRWFPRSISIRWSRNLPHGAHSSILRKYLNDLVPERRATP